MSQTHCHSRTAICSAWKTPALPHPTPTSGQLLPISSILKFRPGAHGALSSRLCALPQQPYSGPLSSLSTPCRQDFWSQDSVSSSPEGMRVDKFQARTNPPDSTRPPRPLLIVHRFHFVYSVNSHHMSGTHQGPGRESEESNGPSPRQGDRTWDQSQKC